MITALVKMIADNSSSRLSTCARVTYCTNELSICPQTNRHKRLASIRHCNSLSLKSMFRLLVILEGAIFALPLVRDLEEIDNFCFQ